MTGSAREKPGPHHQNSEGNHETGVLSRLDKERPKNAGLMTTGLVKAVRGPLQRCGLKLPLPL